MVESARFSDKLSLRAISSASFAQECFVIRLYIKDIRASTSSRRLSERRVPSLRELTSETISSSSRRHESILRASSSAAGRYLETLFSCLKASLREASIDSPSCDAEASYMASTEHNAVFISSAFARLFCSCSSSSSSPERRAAASSWRNCASL